MIEVKTFTPAQAAKISGVNATLQRDWRRRKILPPLESAKASFSPFEVAKLMALNSVAVQGLSPLTYRGASEKMAAAIVRHALLDRAAYTGAFDEYIPTDVSELLENEKIRKQYKWDYTVETFEEEIEGLRVRSLSSTLTKQHGHNVIGVGAFVLFAEGSFDFYAGPTEPFEVIDDTDPRLQGAIIIVDLAALGKEFRKRAGPFAHIHPEAMSDRNGYPWAVRNAAEIARLRSLAKNSSVGGDGHV